MTKEIKQITIVNAHWNNRGDEAALLAVVYGLKKNYTKSSITILFKDDNKIQQFPNIENVNINESKFNAKIWDIWLTVFTRGMIGINRKLKFMVNTLLESDLIIYSPGGSVINNRFFWRKQMEYLTPFLCAKLYNIPLFIAAPSIGPFDLNKSNRVLKYLLKVPKLFIVRENISREYLNKIGINKKVITTIDSAFYDDIKEEEGQKELNKYTSLKEYLVTYDKVIGITITDFSWHVKYGKDKNLALRINNSFKKFISKLEEEGYGIVFIPQLFGNQNDYDYMNRFLNNNTFILKDTYNTYFQQFVISKLYAVIGMRYHSNIFSAKVGTPFLPIVYEEKMEGFVEMANLNKYAISLDELSIEKLEEKFELINNNYKEIKSMLCNESLIWKNKAMKTIDLLGMYK